MIPPDTILSYAVYQKTGMIKLADAAPAGGNTPRHFSLNKEGNLVAIGVQRDGWVVVLEWNVETDCVGKTVGVVRGLSIEGRFMDDIVGPVCVIWDE